MRDLQNANRRAVVQRQCALDVLADVAGEEQLDEAIANPEDERVVVAHALALPVRHGRMKDVQIDGADLQCVS